MTLRGGNVLFDRDGRMLPASSDNARLAPLPTYSRKESRAEVGSTVYDLVLKQGQVIDPGDKRYGRYDIAINGTRSRRSPIGCLWPTRGSRSTRANIT